MAILVLAALPLQERVDATPGGSSLILVPLPSILAAGNLSQSRPSSSCPLQPLTHPSLPSHPPLSLTCLFSSPYPPSSSVCLYLSFLQPEVLPFRILTAALLKGGTSMATCSRLSSRLNDGSSKAVGLTDLLPLPTTEVRDLPKDYWVDLGVAGCFSMHWSSGCWSGAADASQ